MGHHNLCTDPLSLEKMGCGCSSAAAAQEPQPRAQSSNGVELVPGQCAIIRNCPNARLNGERVVCEEYNAALGEWTVKGDKFPLSVGMSLGAQFLEVTEPAPTLLSNDSCMQRKANTYPMTQSSNGVELVPGQCAIIRNCPNARLNGQRVVCEEYNAALGEWTVKGDKFPLSVGMSLGAQFLEVTKPSPTLLSKDSCMQGKAHTCPSGHKLESHAAPNSDYVCDVCGREVAKGETLWGCRQCDYDRCQQCVNKDIVEFTDTDVVEFTDTDGDKVVLKRNSDLGIDFYVNDVLRVRTLIKLEVRDHDIHVQGISANNWGCATVRSGQEYILKQALDMFAEKAL